jgi:hypothetical protein
VVVLITSHSGDGDNIPFWRWLKGNQMFSISITCCDYDGEKLSNLQLNNVTDCFREYYGSKESKLVSLIIKNEAISITLIRISLLKGI